MSNRDPKEGKGLDTLLLLCPHLFCIALLQPLEFWTTYSVHMFLHISVKISINQVEY